MNIPVRTRPWLIIASAGVALMAGITLFLLQAESPYTQRNVNPDKRFEAARERAHSSSAAAVSPSRFPEQARRLLALPQDSERETAIRDLAYSWATENVTDATAWATNLDHRPERHLALTHVCLATVRHDPRKAIDIARVNGLENGFSQALAMQWSETDFASAIQWAQSEQTGAFRELMLTGIIQTHAQNAPEEAARWVVNAFAPGPRQEEAALAVLHQWLLKDPDAAGQWVTLFPEGPLKERAVQEIQNLKAFADAQYRPSR